MISFALKGILLLGLASSASAYTVVAGKLDCGSETVNCAANSLLLSRISEDPADQPYECVADTCYDNQVKVPLLGFRTVAAFLVQSGGWSCGTCNDQENLLCPEAFKCSSNVDISAPPFINPDYRDFVGYQVNIVALDGCRSFCMPVDEVVPFLDADPVTRGCGPCSSSYNSGPCSVCGLDREVTNPNGFFIGPIVTCEDIENFYLNFQIPAASCDELQADPAAILGPTLVNCQCEDIENCGDNALTGGEDCDGNLFAGGVTCETYAGGGFFDGGTLNCINCQFDTSSCTKCGNGDAEDGEDCDGADLAGQTCASAGFTAGTLACNNDCTLNTDGCTTCGNDDLEAGEECDTSKLGGADCTTVPGGFDGGNLGCNANCEYDTSACTSSPTCGDGVLEAPEECDGAALGGKTCSDLLGFNGGTLACKADCTFDTSQCTPTPVCGNGVVDGSEECDGAALGGKTCSDIAGFDGGTLACAADCKFDTSKCDLPPTACNSPFDNLNCFVEAIVKGIQDVICVITLGWLCPP